ncbi:PREDICTED: receptor activity-modifying protein 1, partial [Nestor notabilis]|uniref:receptor activity-modifying protein 1 n=1 Tax=Nestor notabilis TaxID=176057 RepID=UPI000523B6F2
LLAHHFIAATACQEADYGWMIRHYCLKQFQLSMEGIGQRLWCDWDETVGTYGELTNCTALIAERLDCYWPNRLVDEFFVAVHKQYFRNCSPSGRALHDPPNGILCPFILLPILVTLLMTALVVWRSKRSESITGTGEGPPLDCLWFWEDLGRGASLGVPSPGGRDSSATALPLHHTCATCLASGGKASSPVAQGRGPHGVGFALEMGSYG